MSGEALNGETCGGCGEGLVGRFCHACGRDGLPPVRDLRSLSADVLENVFSFTVAVPRTLRALLTRPSLVPRTQRAGDRKAFLSPVKLYVSASLVFFLFLEVTQVTFVQLRWFRTEQPMAVRSLDEGGPTGMRMEERFLHPTWRVPRDAEIVQAFDAGLPAISDEGERAFILLARELADDPKRINALIADGAPRILWLMMPLHGLLLWALFSRGRLLAEHLVLALWAHSLLFLLLIGGSIWNILGLTHGLAVVLLAYQIYFTGALKGYYETGWASAALKALGHSTVYFSVWLLITIGFFFVQALAHLPSSARES